MTGEQKETIQKMREQGEGYARIADTVRVSVNTVKSFCRRNNLLSRNASDATMSNEATNNDICKHCGKKLIQREKGKPKQFCDDACRFEWWSANRDQLKRKAMYHLTCACCGAPFDSYGNSGRKYCSHGCYIKHRYLKEARHDRSAV